MTPVRAMVLTECATGRGEGGLDGVAGVDRGARLFESGGAASPECLQDEDRGDGKRNGARDDERFRHAPRRCVHHLSEREAQAKTCEGDVTGRKRHDGEDAGSARVVSDGTIHRKPLSFSGLTLGERVYRVREGGRSRHCGRDLAGRDFRWTRDRNDVLKGSSSGDRRGRRFAGRVRGGSAGSLGPSVGHLIRTSPPAIRGAVPSIGRERNFFEEELGGPGTTPDRFGVFVAHPAACLVEPDELEAPRMAAFTLVRIALTLGERGGLDEKPDPLTGDLGAGGEGGLSGHWLFEIRNIFLPDTRAICELPSEGLRRP